jgi:transposase-like protein
MRGSAFCPRLIIATCGAIMLIVLDCPQCGKRYELDASLAGKKSRCKRCGEVFRIPVPSTLVGPSSPDGKAPAAATAGPRARERSLTGSPASPPKGARAATPPDPPPILTPAIVINCPRCRNRHELDVALAGRKSKCKRCGEIFSIPVPQGPIAEPSSSATREESARDPALVPSQWQSLLEDEPASLKASHGPAGEVLDDADLPPPPRAAYPSVRRRSSRSSESSQIDLAVTVSGWFCLAGLLSGVGFLMFAQIAGPSWEQTSVVGGIIFILLLLGGMCLSLWGSIWLLVIAFAESVLHGLLCLMAPLYAFGYIIGRFDKTRGAAALIFSPALVVILFGGAGAVDRAMRFPGHAARPRASASNGRAEGEPSSGGVWGGSNPQKRTANRAAVEAAEKASHDYVTALEAVTNQLASIQRQGGGAGQRMAAIRTVAAALKVGERVYQIKLGVDEWTALKYRIGEKVRSSLSAAKAEITGLESIPGQRGMFRDSIERIDKELDMWGLKPHDDVVPELVDAPSSPPA